MASILIVVLGASKPSSRLRMLPLAADLRKRGHAVSIIEVPRSPVARFSLLGLAARHDLVVLQKKLFPTAFVTLLRRANPQLVFDTDDAVMFHELERGQSVTGGFFQRFMAVACASRAIVTGNGYIADFARAARPSSDKNVEILPTPIDTVTMPAKSFVAKPGTFVVGWIGTKGNLGQLLPLADALRTAHERIPGFCLRIVADSPLELTGVRTEFKPWRAEEEVADLHGFDVGIMPLGDSLWNRGKGGYKLLQYMAAGLPAIASPVGINAEIIQHGSNGLLARNTADWADLMVMLADQPELRETLGNAARRTVEQHYSLSVYLERYTQLIEGCLA